MKANAGRRHVTLAQAPQPHLGRTLKLVKGLKKGLAFFRLLEASTALYSTLLGAEEPALLWLRLAASSRNAGGQEGCIDF
ncbi:MAG: hypothetical protein ACTSWP_01670 [Candidatus Freyarchaeota archaeon]